VRVTYTPKRMYENNTLVDEIAENEWAYLTRTEKPVGIVQNYNYQIDECFPE
jgi:hypothetical protein